jgi:hypothetical protein
MPVEFTSEEHAILTEIVSDPVGVGYESVLTNTALLVAKLSKPYYADFSGKCVAVDAPVKQVMPARIESVTVEQVDSVLTKYKVYVSEQATNTSNDKKE